MDMDKINAATWRAAADEAYRRAGRALCDPSNDGFYRVLEWQARAVDYTRRAYILTNKGDQT